MTTKEAESSASVSSFNTSSWDPVFVTVATVTKTGSQDDVLNDDTDADDSASLVVTNIQPSGGSSSTVSSGTTYSNGTSLTGTYGTLTIGADGSYTYTADQAAAAA